MMHCPKTELNLDALAKNFMDKCSSLSKISVAVVYPCTPDSLMGAVEAAEIGLIEPILIGPTVQIEKLAQEQKLNLSGYNIIDAQDVESSVHIAIQLVNEGKAQCLMKGSLHTDELMREVVSKGSNLRTERRISHAFVVAMEGYHKPFVVTDAAVNINPDLMCKKDILQNAIDLVRIFKPDTLPKAAIISAVETVNPSIPSTIDAACLSKMADRGQIQNAIVDGPFAYDNVISLHAAKVKNIQSPVIGDADIFMFPNLEAGNIFVKQLMFITNTLSAGIILGAKIPIILTSRADGVQSRIGSCALATLMVHHTN